MTSSILSESVAIAGTEHTLSIVRTTRRETGIAMLEWPQETLEGDVLLVGQWFLGEQGELHVDLENTGDYEGAVEFFSLLDQLMSGLVAKSGGWLTGFARQS